MNPITMNLVCDTYIRLALQEDINGEDVSTNAVMPGYQRGEVQLIAKEAGVIAGLDVYEQEPVTAENPLFALKNTALAPHVSALTYETNYNGGIICAQSIINVAQGGKPLYPLW